MISIYVNDCLARYYYGIVGTARFRSLANVSGESSGKLLTILYTMKLMHFLAFTRSKKKLWERKY